MFNRGSVITIIQGNARHVGLILEWEPGVAVSLWVQAAKEVRVFPWDAISRIITTPSPTFETQIEAAITADRAEEAGIELAT